MTVIAEWIRDLFHMRSEKNKFDALPININPIQDASAARHAGRLSRLYAVKDPSEDVLQEIKQRQAALESKGYDAPKTSDDAHNLCVRLGE